MSQTRASPLCVLCDSVFQNDDATDSLLYRLLLAAAQEELPCHVSSLAVELHYRASKDSHHCQN